MASWIAFAPIIFQAARAMRDLGILEVLLADRAVLDTDTIASRCGLSRYGAAVLLDMGASIGIVRREDGGFRATRVAHFLQMDEMTRVNLDFVQDVCYAGMAALPEAITTGTPAGLPALSTEHATVYEALATLPEDTRRSWFNFDHYYSDAAFDEALPHVLESAPAQIMDIGGNTGKFTRKLLSSNADLHVTIVDLPGQLASTALDDNPRVTLHPHDLLGGGELPGPVDTVWISQVLDCFGEDDILRILTKARAALRPGGQLWILEPLWDRQRYEAAELSLHATSLYFTAIANGTSRFYDLGTMRRIVEEADMCIAAVHDNLGTGHTLIRVSAA